LPERRLTGAPAALDVLAALVVLAMSFVLAAPAGAATRAVTQDPGSIGIRLVDAPLATKDDPRARVYIVDHLKPGTTIKRRIEVSNTTSAATRLTLYAAAASITKGSFLGAAADTPNDLTTWTTVTPDMAEVPAGGRVTALVTIAVPKDAAPGEQYGVVWAEARSAAKAGGGVTQVSRVGIRLYVSIGPGGPPAANFAIDSLTAQRSPDGRPVVIAKVHNTGGRALDMRGTLNLSDGPGGLRAGPFPANLGVSLGIGETEPVTIMLDERLPAGPWEAQLSLHSGLLDRTAKATLTFPDTGAAAAVPTNAEGPVWLYVAGAGLLLVLLALAAWIGARRRREHDTLDDGPAPPRSVPVAGRHRVAPAPSAAPGR
jgi:hypothetical protein